MSTRVITAILDGRTIVVRTPGATSTPGAGGGAPFVHVQTTPSTVWTVTHNLGFDPAGIRVHDTAGNDLGGVVIEYITPGTALRAVFDQQTTGTLLAR